MTILSSCKKYFQKVSGLPSEARSQHFEISITSIKLKCKGIMDSSGCRNVCDSHGAKGHDTIK
jgi:hypothetical protein